MRGTTAVVPGSQVPEAVSRGRSWYAVCVLAIMVADDYKVRVRSPQDTLSGGIDVFVVLALAAYGAVACYLLLSQRGLPRMRRLPLFLGLAIAYVTLLAVSLLDTPYLTLGGARVAQMTVLLALTLVAAARATRADLHRFAHGFLGLVALSVLSGLVLRMPRIPLEEARFTWLRIHPVTAGLFAALATVIALCYLLDHASPRPGPHWPRWVYGVLLLIVGAGLAGTQTRGALLGALAGAIVFGLLHYRGRRRIELAVAVITVSAIAVIWAGGRLAAYFARGEDAAQLATFSARTDLWSLAWNAFLQHPMYGWGTGASRGIFLDETGLGGAHNAVVNVAVDLGAVGVFVWLSLLLALVVAVWRLPRRTADGLGRDRAIVLSVFACLVVDGFTFEGMGAVTNVAATWLFVLLAWTGVLVRDARHQPPSMARSVLPWRRAPLAP